MLKIMNGRYMIENYFAFDVTLDNLLQLIHYPFISLYIIIYIPDYSNLILTDKIRIFRSSHKERLNEIQMIHLNLYYHV